MQIETSNKNMKNIYK